MVRYTRTSTAALRTHRGLEDGKQVKEGVAESQLEDMREKPRGEEKQVSESHTLLSGLR
jgi:hypothetical protein